MTPGPHNLPATTCSTATKLKRLTKRVSYSSTVTNNKIGGIAFIGSHPTRRTLILCRKREEEGNTTQSKTLMPTSERVGPHAPHTHQTTLPIPVGHLRAPKPTLICVLSFFTCHIHLSIEAPALPRAPRYLGGGTITHDRYLSEVLATLRNGLFFFLRYLLSRRLVRLPFLNGPAG